MEAGEKIRHNERMGVEDKGERWFGDGGRVVDGRVTM
jgi:hypothetical protein